MMASSMLAEISNKQETALDRKIAAAKYNLVSTVQNARKRKLKLLINELMEYKNEQRISDDDFTEVLEIVMGSYVENEVNSRLTEFMKPIFHGLEFKIK